MLTTSSHTARSDITTSIDMFNPAQTCEHLGLDEQGLIDLVNRGQLVAYYIGHEIRFKVLDVRAALANLAAA